MTTWHIIIACHNRKNLTVQALQRAASSASDAGVEIDFTVFDDGSTDGTADAIRELELPVKVLVGNGSAYWAKSMATAEKFVMTYARDEDWIVWLNDDVVLDEDAFTRALRATRRKPTAVLVGSTRDPDSGRLTYGGYRRVSKIHPLRLDIVHPRESETPIDTFNGNLVFVPLRIARKLGGIDGLFAHSGADTDYGFRCSDANVPTFVLPSTFGTCPRNPVFRGTIMEEWQRFISIKGAANPLTTARMLRRHAPPGLWPGLWAGTFLLWWLRRMTRAVVLRDTRTGEGAKFNTDGRRM